MGEAKAVLEKAARVNGNTLPSEMCTLLDRVRLVRFIASVIFKAQSASKFKLFARFD